MTNPPSLHERVIALAQWERNQLRVLPFAALRERPRWWFKTVESRKSTVVMATRIEELTGEALRVIIHAHLNGVAGGLMPSAVMFFVKLDDGTWSEDGGFFADEVLDAFLAELREATGK